MPIRKDEFNRGETRGSWEDVITDLLGDGNAYSLDEIAENLGIMPPKDSDDKFEYVLYSLDRTNLLITLNGMSKDGRIVSKSVSDKGGKTNTYYMRKDFLENVPNE